ncbi:MAG: hypothetical protein JWO32_1300 [Bacteroidetes bacterium]|nr:hypothetical protein [Bacteroidota bacterium]
MITTFTPTLPVTETPKQPETLVSSALALPSEDIINFLLNYSKNLEVKKSVYMANIELIKS